MDEYPGVIINLEGDVVQIKYSAGNPSEIYNVNVNINTFEIEGQENSTKEEKISHVKTNALINVIFKYIQGKFFICKPDFCVLFGKIEGYNEETGNISVSVLNEKETLVCPIYSVYFQEQTVSWEDARNLMIFPVEILMNREFCVKVTILNKIPFEISACFHSCNENYIFLQNENFKYRILPSRCFYNTHKRSIKIKEENELKEKIGKIIVCLSAYRVEFEKPIKRSNRSLELVEETNLNNIKQGMRVFFSDQLPELKRFKDLAHWKMYSNKDINCDLQLTIYIGMLETFLLENNHENIQRLLRPNKNIYGSLKNIINAQLIFSNFYGLVNKELNELKNCAKDTIKSDINFEQISQDYSVSFNVFAIIKNNVMNNFYGKINKNSVINLLIFNDFSAVIYSPYDLRADGFDASGNETGERNPRNTRSAIANGLNESSFYHLLELISQDCENYSRNRSQSSLAGNLNYKSKIDDMISDDNKSVINSAIEKLLSKCRK